MRARMTEKEHADYMEKFSTPVPGKRVVTTPPRLPARATGRTRHVAGTPNKTEARYITEVLQPAVARGEIVKWWFERFTMKLADDTRYTPDFLCQLASGELVLHEVKGFMEEDARVKIAVAAEYFPFRLYIAKFLKNAWEVKEA